MRSLDVGVYVGFNALEAHNSLVPPRLVIEYTLSGLAGDINEDGAVDSADYVAWRKNGGTLQQYHLWKANFGQTAGSGAGELGTLASHVAIPEPATLWPLILVGASVGLRRNRI
jgi:hypothetical protein